MVSSAWLQRRMPRHVSGSIHSARPPTHAGCRAPTFATTLRSCALLGALAAMRLLWAPWAPGLLRSCIDCMGADVAGAQLTGGNGAKATKPGLRRNSIALLCTGVLIGHLGLHPRNTLKPRAA